MQSYHLIKQVSHNLATQLESVAQTYHTMMMLLCNLTTQCESIAHFYHPIRKSCIILLPNWKVLHNLTTQQETVTTQWESVGYFTTKWKSIV